MRTNHQIQPLSALVTCGLGILGAVTLLLGTAGSLPCRAAEGKALRVGITPDYPPLVFRQADRPSGVEVDLAKALGAELKRPVEFVVLNWDQLIPELLDNQIDIIMSGMSITKARQLRIAFTDPYLHNELRAIFRQKDAERFKTPADILNFTGKIGVIAGTTADVFVTKNCPNAQRELIASRSNVGPLLIRGGRMDLFIDDTFALAQMISENEAELAYLKEPLSEDDLAWGMRQSDRELLAAANLALARWKLDGTLEKTLDHWIPYLKKLQSKQPRKPSP